MIYIVKTNKKKEKRKKDWNLGMRTQKTQRNFGMENNYHSGLGHRLEYAFVNSAKALNRPVSWLVYHYVEIPLCPCHITCWDEASAADRDPRPNVLFDLLMTLARLARSSVTPTSFTSPPF